MLHRRQVKHLEPDFQEDGVREGTSHRHTHPSTHGGTSGPWYLGDPFLHPGFSLFHPFAHRFLGRQKLPLQMLQSGPLCKVMEQGPTLEQKDKLLIRAQFPQPHHSQKPNGLGWRCLHCQRRPTFPISKKKLVEFKGTFLASDHHLRTTDHVSSKKKKKMPL